jgi:hypothetical protein
MTRVYVKNMTKIERVHLKLQDAQRQVELLEKEYRELRLEALQQVKVSRKGQTTTLTFGNRVIKAKGTLRNYRLNVYENGIKIISEYPWGIHDLRFAIAQNLV